ncbi:MAG: response regulator transcription factor [Myxococcales bacterium]|nr:response regulator transcription factor [Myxococcales bacterium]
MAQAAWRVLVVEDEWIAAQDARALLERNGFEVIGVAQDGDGARALLEEKQPDIALLDIGLPKGTGVELGRELGARHIPIVYVSGCTNPEVLEQAGATRPRGFLGKPYTEGQLVSALRVALAERAVAPDTRDYRAAIERITNVLVEFGVVAAGSKAAEPRTDVPELSQLSTREWEVVRALLSHERVPQIAKRLHISPSTVRNHLKSIYGKLGVHSQQELIGRLL